MEKARDEICDDGWEDQPCAICRGEVSDEFVEFVERAVVEAEKGSSMTAEEAIAFIRSF
jgi:hypothetical protein